MLSRLQSIASQIARLLLATFVCFFLSSPTILVVKTTEGTHCPTAQVQIIEENSGGSRVPQIGDPEFKQCQCAEKRQAQEQLDIERVALTSLIFAIDNQPIGTIHLPIPIFPTFLRPPSFQVSRYETPTVPLVPPPNNPVSALF